MLKILVAVHKPYQLPECEPYLPIEVGADLRPNLNLPGIRDNSGENISKLNPYFCELTALYWARKNLPHSINWVGLVHYRRYFGIKSSGNPLRGIFKLEDWQRFLKECPVVLPPKRNYLIETVESQYSHAHHAEDLKVLRKVIKEKHPDYLPALNSLLGGRKTHILNMFVMRRDLFDRYCDWLFDVLFTVQKELNISSYSPNDQRVFGFLSERLLDVWLTTNGVPYLEKPIFHTERVNWIKKGTAFLMRKFGLKI